MAQDKSLDAQIQNSTSDNNTEKPSVKPEDIIKPLEDDDELAFDFWEDLKDSLPSWTDEVIGITLLIFGILSFISLFIPSEAVVAVAWADILTTLFGNGSVIVAGALFAFGVALWLPKLGLKIKFSSMQMLAIEFAFLSSLAVLHLSNSDVELRALARAGQGGGLIGWGLSFPFYWLLGRSVALFLFAIITTVCIVVIIGIQRRQIVETLTGFSQRLQKFSEQLLTTKEEPKTKNDLDVYKELITSSVKEQAKRTSRQVIRLSSVLMGVSRNTLRLVN